MQTGAGSVIPVCVKKSAVGAGVGDDPMTAVEVGVAEASSGVATTEVTDGTDVTGTCVVVSLQAANSNSTRLNRNTRFISSLPLA